MRTVKLGVKNFGTIGNPRTQILDKKYVVITGEEGQTVQYSVNLLDNAVGFFRPTFRIPEDISVENIEVTDSPATNGEPELTIVEGTILERSAIPDPEKSDYPDCRFTCHFQGNSIIKGKPCPQEMSLVLEGFADRKLLGTKDLKPGDRVICIALPFNKLPQERQTTQQADDLNLTFLENYYAIDIRKIKMFSDMPAEPSSGILFSNVSTNNQHDNIDSKMYFGLDVFPTSSSCVIKATTNNKNAVFPQSTMEFGIRGTGMYHPVLQMLQTETIKRRENLTISMPVNQLDNIGFFQPAFKVPEGVIVENVEVTESPAANGESELTVVEGTILERSAIPDPEKSDYPDCRFTCHFKGNSIVKGKPCPQELSLILEGFADRKLMGTKDLKPGDRVICITMPFNKLPQARQTTQQADDLNLFALESYYAIDVRKINEFSDLPGTPSSGIAFTDASNNKPYVSVFERHVNPPIKEELRKAQQESIAQELQKIEAMLAPYTPEKIAELRQKFTQVWEAEKAKDPPNYNRVVRGKTEYVWRNVENSFWALPTNYRLPEYPENPIAPYNLEALIALRDFLEANGCQFLVSPVPPAYEIAARVINPEFRGVPDFQTAYMARQLLKHGIETFYPSQTLIDNFHRYPWAFFFPHNDHPSDTTQDVMTDIVAAKLRRYHFPNTLDEHLFSIKYASHYYGDANKRYWFPQNCNIGANKPNTPYRCRQVWYDGKVLVSNDKESPILVIGNSYMRTPMFNVNESFPILLASKININIRRYQVNAMGPMTTIVQQFFSSPDTLLSHVKIVILAVGTNHLCTGSAFNNIKEMNDHAERMSGKNSSTLIPSNPT